MTYATQRNFLLAFGANLPSEHGTPAETLRLAIDTLDGDDLALRGVSAFYRNPAFPAGSGPDYINAAAYFVGSLSPQQALARIHTIEARLGRIRRNRWGARPVDIDLIAIDDMVLPDAESVRRWVALPEKAQRTQSPATLILPHPRLQDRAFVLTPAMELWPDWRHPVLGRSLRDLHAALPEAAKAAMIRIDPPVTP